MPKTTCHVNIGRQLWILDFQPQNIGKCLYAEELSLHIYEIIGHILKRPIGLNVVTF